MPTTYDNADWHYHDVPAGADSACAATHIGVYLAWAARTGLVAADAQLSPQVLDRLAAGEVTGTRVLLDELDGTLGSADLSPEGAAFTDETYDDYLVLFVEALDEDDQLYGTPESPELYREVASSLDQELVDWRDSRGPG